MINDILLSVFVGLLAEKKGEKDGQCQEKDRQWARKADGKSAFSGIVSRRL